VVHWLGAVQAQDYAGAKWGLGIRMRRATDARNELRVLIDEAGVDIRADNRGSTFGPA
jgi:hypothetical protein